MPVNTRRLHSHYYSYHRFLRLIVYGLSWFFLSSPPASALQISIAPTADYDSPASLLMTGERSADQWSGQWDWLTGEKLSLSTKFSGQYNLESLEKKNSFSSNLLFSPGENLKFKFNLRQDAAYGNYLPSSVFDLAGDLSGRENFFAPGGKRESQIGAGWEWAVSRRFSLNSDFQIKAHPGGREQNHNLAGNLLLAPRASLKFNLNHQQINGQDKQWQEVCLESDWGSSQYPWKFIARSSHLSQEAGEGYRQEVNLTGGLQKSGMKIDFSGSLKQQQGCWEGLAASHSLAYKTDLQFSKLKLAWANESSAPDQGATLDKSRFSANYCLSPATELYALQNRDDSAALTGQERFGLKHSFGQIRLEAAEESQQSLSGDRNWREIKLVWKNQTPPPSWAQALGRLDFGEAARFGFSNWGRCEPGLSLTYRQGAGLGEADCGLRLIYQRSVGNYQIGLGHEQNPCLSSEPLTLQKGERNFLEVGFPISDKLAGRVGLARQTIDGNQGRGWAFSLGSANSTSANWEGFFSTAARSDGSDSSYGLRYSRRANQADYLSLKACFNPNLQANLATPEWRIDIAFSRPM